MRTCTYFSMISLVTVGSHSILCSPWLTHVFKATLQQRNERQRRNSASSLSSWAYKTTRLIAAHDILIHERRRTK